MLQICCKINQKQEHLSFFIMFVQLINHCGHWLVLGRKPICFVVLAFALMSPVYTELNSGRNQLYKGSSI